MLAGTDNDLNWIIDSDMALTNYSFVILRSALNTSIHRYGNGTRVHTGFYDAWLSMAPQVELLVAQTFTIHCPTCTHLTTTGPDTACD